MNRNTVILLLLSSLPLRAQDRQVTTIRFASIAPQDIATDSSGKHPSYWVTALFDKKIYHYDAAWNLLGSVDLPFADQLTGIAYNPVNDTLLIADPTVAPGDFDQGIAAVLKVVEVNKDGTELRWRTFSLDPVLNPGGRPRVWGLAYVPQSDAMEAALLIYESVAAKIYGFTLDGTRLFSFVHLDDPDGYPGGGLGVEGGGALPILGDQGRLTGVEFMGYREGEYVIYQVEVNEQFEVEYSGRYIPLPFVSGKAAGFVRGTWKDPGTASEIDVFYIAADTKPEIAVYKTTPLPIYAPFNLACDNDGDAVVLSWKNAEVYDRLLLRRDGAPPVPLEAAATSFRDENVPFGEHRYELWGEQGETVSLSATCEVLVGPGQVLSRFELDGAYAADFTIGPDGLFWIAGTDPTDFYDLTLDLKIRRYNPDQQTYEEPISLLPFFEGNIHAEFSRPDRITYDDVHDRIYIVDRRDNSFHTFDSSLEERLRPPVNLALRDGEEAEVYIGPLVFSPSGNGNQGSIFFVEAYEATVYEISLVGEVIRSFRHVDWDRDPPLEADSPFGPYVYGIARPPEGNGAFLDLSGGTAWDGTMTRIFRARTSDGTPTGYEIPLTGIQGVAEDGYEKWLGVLWQGDRLFVLNGFEDTGVLYELRTDVSSPPPPTDLVCVQDGLKDALSISFTNNGPYDRIAIERDGALLTELPGDATDYRDSTVSPGIHSYSITAYQEGKALSRLTCEKRIGVGAHLWHTALWPPSDIRVAARDPDDGSYYLATAFSSAAETDYIYHIDAAGRVLDMIPSPHENPWEIAALAVSPAGTGRSITTIAWHTAQSLEEQQPLRLTHLSETGTVLEGPTEFTPPLPPPEPFIVSPASLHWDRSAGFWYLEQSAGIMWHIDRQGRHLEHFLHPAPPTHQFVTAAATSYCPERGVFYLSTDTPGTKTITHLVECTPHGVLTGHHVSLDATELSSVKATFVEGTTVRVFGMRRQIPAMVTLKAFDSEPRVLNLQAALDDRRPLLTWEIAGTAERVVVERNGGVAAELPGDVRSFLDGNPLVKAENLYVVRAEAGTARGAHGVVTIFVPPPESPFVRGDAAFSGSLNIADAIYTLAFLFAGGPAPACMDAADADDDGEVRINDPIYALQHLFQNGPDPLPPFPTEGFDTTEDELSCWP